MSRDLLVRIAPALFVVLWSTGFIGAKYGLPYAEPFTLLFLRFTLTLGVLVPLIAILRPRLGLALRDYGHLAASGLLLHGVYLGGIFTAIRGQLPAGLTALIVGLQPVLTSLLAARVVGERTDARHWLGIALGFLGVVFVLGAGPDRAHSQSALWAAVVALIGITAGTLYQKRFCTRHDLLAVALFQYLPTWLLFAIGAWLLETREVQWTPEFVAALVWLVFGLSLGAILLLAYLIRQKAASRVTSLFYLVPPATAVESWLLFGETLRGMQIVGIVLAALGVYLVMNPRPRRTVA